MIASCTSRGSLSQTSSGPYGLLSRNVAPCPAPCQDVHPSRNLNWWQATKFALSMRYVELIGRGLNRRCDTVTDPAFFES